MTDQQYFECYAELVNKLASSRELDDELFYRIFEGKIKPIVRNAYMPAAGYFAAFDFDDVCQDIFIKLWTRCVGAYFMNDKYEKDPAWFLGWCKIVIKNHVTSLLRNKGNFAKDPLEDPDHPVTVSVYSDPSKDLILHEVLTSMCRALFSLSSKPEMKLTWLGVYLPVYCGEAADKIEANHLFIERYLGGTLRDLSLGVKAELEETPFFGEVADGFSRITDEIGQERGGVRKEDAEVRELLGDDPLGKISDWVYKINKKLAEGLSSKVVDGTFE